MNHHLRIVSASSVFLSLWMGAAELSGQTRQAQQIPWQTVVRDLEHPDVNVRLGAMRALRESGHPEAIPKIARLLADPVDQVQLEAIATELSFFLGEPIVGRRRVALVVEVRGGGAKAAFDKGSTALLPRLAPPELIQGLGAAAADDNVRLRTEATYALGVITRPPIGKTTAEPLMASLRHTDPGVRLAAARVLGRLRVGEASDPLIYAINDPRKEVSLASMWALGQIRAVQAIQSLNEQLAYYKRGWEAATALDALARIADRSILPLFEAHRRHRDPEMRRLALEGIGRIGDRTKSLALQSENDSSPVVRLATAFALQKMGQPYVDHLVQGLRDRRTTEQAREYLLELGPAIVPPLESYLRDPEPAVRAAVAETLGLIGAPAAIAALESGRKDPDPYVASAADRAVTRIKLQNQH